MNMRKTKINKLIDYCTEYFIKETGHNIKVLKYSDDVNLMSVSNSKSKKNYFTLDIQIILLILEII